MKSMQMPSKLDLVDMINSKTICLYLTIVVFWLVLAKGQRDCSLKVYNKFILVRMPLAFKLDATGRASMIYPDKSGNLIIKEGNRFLLSCLSSHFRQTDFHNNSDIFVTCVEGKRLRYKKRIFDYIHFKCQHILISSLEVTNQKCRPNNNTVIHVGFKMAFGFYPLYSVCFDMVRKNSLYTWYNVRWPFFKHHQQRKRLRLFFQNEEVYGNLNLEEMYGKIKIQKTVNKILKLEPYSEKFVRKHVDFLTRGHYASRIDFYFTHEQSATFNYVNVVPQWYSSNSLWTLIEDIIRKELIKNSYSRRVIISGMYGTCTLPDTDNIQQPLYLAMPQKQVVVPLFMWKMIYDADNENNSFVFIGLNNPYADLQTVENNKLRCNEILCPGDIRDRPGQMIYCCDRISFEREFGEFDPIVYRVPPLTTTTTTPAL